MTLRALFSLLLSSLMLSGCTNAPESITSVEWQTHKQRLETITHFRAIGKLGYVDPEQRQSLNFFWKHSPSMQQLRLTTLLGQTALSMTITPQGSTIETYDDQFLAGSDASQLIHRLSGLRIPVNNLSDWLLGLPTDADSFQLSSTNTLQLIEKQSGESNWNITYQRYSDIEWYEQTLPLPSKLKLNTLEVKINLLITKWNLSE